MRKLTASLYVSLDGVVEAPETWHFPYLDDEMGAVIGQGIAGCDAFLLGRRTYEEWAAFWPSQDPGQNPLAPAINSKRKFVASRSLDTATWENSSVIRGDLAEEASKLKEQAGGEISVIGSATLVRSLLQAGLLDELRLLLHPIVVGKGARLFDGTSDQFPLELVESQALTTGVLYLTYRPA